MPRKQSLNWFIPALANRSVGSLWGIRLELETTVWPRSAKDFRKRARISLPVMVTSSYENHSRDASRALKNRKMAAVEKPRRCRYATTRLLSRSDAVHASNAANFRDTRA